MALLATAVAAALPAGPQATPAWLIETRAAMLVLGPARSRFSTSWCALSLLARADKGGAEPEAYGPDQQCDLAYALDEGCATLQANGGLMITKLGREEWELE